MKLLVTGAGGQVGRALLRAADAFEGDLVGLRRDDLDVTDRDAVLRAVERHAPEVIVNAAAYTAVDRAEAEPEAAFAVNRDGPAHLAAACAEAGIPLVHFSTDYVFDGTKGTPYVETDPVTPLGVYGQSKWTGEEAVRERLGRHVILRTSWVFSAHGHNFVKTILRLSREREVLRVVADQYGNPTAAADIARAALHIAKRAVAEPDVPPDQVRGRLWGTVHGAGTPATTWHGLAEAVIAEARRHGPVLAERIEPVPTSAYPTAARRPPDARLDTARLTEVWGLEPPPWREAVREVVAELAGRGR